MLRTNRLKRALAEGREVHGVMASLPTAASIELIAEAGFPAGVFNLVMGRGREVGEAIVNARDVDAVSFTGSVAIARFRVRDDQT